MTRRRGVLLAGLGALAVVVVLVRGGGGDPVSPGAPGAGLREAPEVPRETSAVIPPGDGEGEGGARDTPSSRIAETLSTLWALGERHDGSPAARAALDRAADHIHAVFTAQGWEVQREPVAEGVANLVVERRGEELPDEVLLLGAHYDTAPGTPGANANASGVAVLLELARSLVDLEAGRTLRLVAFVNGEGRHARRFTMGARVHAREARARGETVVAMLSLDSVGVYSRAPDSQAHPEMIEPPFSWLLPSVGDFVAVIGDEASGDLAEVVAESLEQVGLRARGGGFPAYVEGVGRSDHWAFWQEGWPGVVVTDTGPYRDHLHHTAEDDPERLDLPTMTRLVPGLRLAVDILLEE